MEDKKELNNEEIKDEVIDNDALEIKEDVEQNIEENTAEFEEVESIVVENTINDNDTKKLELRDIELQLQELEIKIDEFEFKNADLENLPDEQLDVYLKLKEDYKSLLKQKKSIKKEEKKALGDNNIEQASLWIFLYGIVMDIMTFPLIAYTIYFNFGQWLITKLDGLSRVMVEGFLPYMLIGIIIFFLPVAFIVLSWFLYINVVKKKIDKKIFSIFGIIQAVFTLGSIIWISIELFA